MLSHHYVLTPGALRYCLDVLPSSRVKLTYYELNILVAGGEAGETVGECASWQPLLASVVSNVAVKVFFSSF